MGKVLKEWFETMPYDFFNKETQIVMSFRVLINLDKMGIQAEAFSVLPNPIDPGFTVRVLFRGYDESKATQDQIKTLIDILGELKSFKITTKKIKEGTLLDLGIIRDRKHAEKSFSKLISVLGKY